MIYIKRPKRIRLNVEEVTHPEPERLYQALAQFFYPIVMKELGEQQGQAHVMAVDQVGGLEHDQADSQP
ncbi:hypothetical protein Alches_18380 [Alicyclobacillus hesperidum subsp. aegles]|uniref:hypothetical protein n=1 Tax=Alicyclobacillus hesperidum TaxID=89784 RepID=UPI00222A1585|nr:hypothetical protein [Alicyclobacillus hesperidum]GLG01798.1 hypothetical protein Alches_18380 [Alicyclobacillus hesperidum subsp. aegles]